ncbi:MAG: glycosyltransferase [Patescibacteria group bacterium]
MKVLMLGRINLLEEGGGDKIQVVNTAKELERLGIKVDIKTGMDFDPTKYDLVHIFQLDWTPETYFYAKKASKSSKPIVLSPIHHNVEEVKKFDDEFVFDFRRLSKFLFKDQFKRDTFKNVYRSIFDFKKLLPTLYTVIKGFKNTQREVLEMSEVCLVQTVKEAEDLKRTFDVDIKWKKVMNGVSRVFKEGKNFKNNFGFEDYILCVGRIEPRKNQLNIIKAVEKLREEEGKDIKLVFIGSIGGLKHFEYNLLFKNLVKENDWVTHIEKVAYEDMVSYYKYAKVGVSASWFETTGLTSLEALYCGTNAVAAGMRAREYLGSYASYCEPDNIDSIKEAIKKEYYAKRPELSEKVKEEYTWENAAKQTLEVYEEVLDKK